MKTTHCGAYDGTENERQDKGVERPESRIVQKKGRQRIIRQHGDLVIWEYVGLTRVGE